MPCCRRISAIGTPASPCFRMLTIWLSVNRDSRMNISLAPESLPSNGLPGGEAYGLAGGLRPRPRRPHFDIFRARLAELGYVEGKNLIFEQRFADCRYDRMPGLAADLVQVPVDVLFTMGTRAARIVAGAVKA